MSSRCSVRVTVSDMPPGGAEAVLRALEPDNTGIPEGMSVSMGEQEGSLVLDFWQEGASGSLAGTIDEVLEHVQLALGVIRQ